MNYATLNNCSNQTPYRYMNTYKNYIDLLRNILKNFDDNEFNDVIKKILSKIFNDYYMNRYSYIYRIDNLYKKYCIGRYNFIKKIWSC